MAWENKKWRVEGITDDKLNARIRDNMNALKVPPTDHYTSIADTVVAVSSSSFTSLSDFALSLTTAGGDIMVIFSSMGRVNTGTGYLDIALDDARAGAANGLIAVTTNNCILMCWLFQGISPGMHEITLLGSFTGGGSFILSEGAQIVAREIS